MPGSFAALGTRQHGREGSRQAQWAEVIELDVGAQLLRRLSSVRRTKPALCSETPFVAEELRSRRLFRLLDGWQSPNISSWALYRTELHGSTKLRAFLAAVSG